MIDLRKLALKMSQSKWESWKIKNGFTDIPKYACVTLNDFFENREKVGFGEEILFPNLNYIRKLENCHAIGIPALGTAVPIEVEDKINKTPLYVRVTKTKLTDSCYTRSGGEMFCHLQYLIESIDNLERGELMENVIIRNGISCPETLFSEFYKDSNLHLISFGGVENPRIKRKFSKKLSKLSRLVSEISDSLNLYPELCPIPLK